MHVVPGRDRLSATLGRPPRAPAIAIGNFDGVHRGHQALLHAARDLALARGGEMGVLTFDPHPARFLAPGLAPPLIIPLARRLELLAAAGADFTVVEPFTDELARMRADAFVATVLIAGLGATDVVVGYDFTFGHRREGDAARLQALGSARGLNVAVVAPVAVEGLVCSSTKVRELVLEGRVEGAALLLGRPFEVTGRVVRGAARGRTLGFPTANVEIEGELAPATGIYACWARRADEALPGRRWRAAVSVGTNPTFGVSGVVTVEAFLLDFQGDLYNARLRLDFVRRLRDERRFERVDDLVAQIADDVTRTRAALPSNDAAAAGGAR